MREAIRHLEEEELQDHPVQQDLETTIRVSWDISAMTFSGNTEVLPVLNGNDSPRGRPACEGT